MTAALLVSVLLIAACGLIYELVAGALASYLLGDSVTQFSTVIGTYLFAMGIGSWLSRFVGRGLVARFILVEIMVGVVGGFSSALLFLAFAYTSAFRLLLYALVLVVGILVGLEIPLLMRILRDRFEFKDVVANVLTFDYLGALGASLLFPIVLVPQLGLVRAPMLFGAINVGVALWTTSVLRQSLLTATRRTLQATCLRRTGAPRRRPVEGQRDPRPRRGQPLRRRGGAVADDALPAHRDDGVEGRPAAVPQRQPAVQLARRVPLSRGAGAPGPGGAALGGARAHPRRRRRPGAARGAAVPGRAQRSRSSISIPR